MAKINPEKRYQGYHVFNVNQSNQSNDETGTNSYTSSPLEVSNPVPNDYQIVLNSSYVFTLDVHTLITNSETTRRAIRNRKKALKKSPARKTLGCCTKGI